MKKKGKRKTGPARMRELGHVSVTLWFPPPAAEKLDVCRGNRPRATFCGELVSAGIRQMMQYIKEA